MKHMHKPTEIPNKIKSSLGIATENHARVEALFSSIGEGVITTDETSRITRANHTAQIILGYSREELIGKHFAEVIQAVHDDGTPFEKIERPITRVFLSGQTISERTNYLRKNGDMIPVSLTVSPIMLKERPIGAVEIFRDISVELKADKMKTEFISVASHQLRTPLTAIKLYSEMLQDGVAGKLTKKQQAFLKTVLAATGRMNELINTLLNITRIEAGSIAVKTKPVKLSGLINDLVEEFEAEISKKELVFKKHIEKGLPLVNTDPLLVKEVYANILSNAIKYTPNQGEVTALLTRENNMVIFSVQDTGFGIPDSEQKYIFTKFFRSQNILSEDVSGTGLGLYLIKAIADNLNGELWFESEENEGTTFYFALPLSGSIEKQGRFKLQAD